MQKKSMMRARISSWSALATLLALACGSPGAAPPAETPPESGEGKKAEPRDFESMSKREAEGLKPHAVAAKGGEWKGQVPATKAPTIQGIEQGTIMEIEIGSEAPIICTVFHTEIVAGAALNSQVQNAAKSVKVEAAALQDVAMLAGSPAALGAIIYTHEGARGTVKTFVQTSLDRPVVCVHDEVGYGQTFKRVARALVESLEYTPILGKPESMSSYRIRMGEQWVGFGQDWIHRRKKGGYVEIEKSVMFLPLEGGGVKSTDSATVQEVDAHGRVLKSSETKLEDGQLSMEIKLEKTKGWSYRYEGRLQGKKVSGTFKTKQGLAGVVSKRKTLQQLLKQPKPATFKLEQYMPSHDPTKATDMAYTLDPAASQLESQLGKLSLTERLDSKGQTLSGEMRIGPLNFQMEALATEGEI